MQNLFSRKEYIYTVYQERSFSRAAQKLFISQPSLSTIVHQVEEEVGLPLFDRTCKPIRMCDDLGYSRSKMMFPIGIVSISTVSILPIGNAAVMYLTNNGYLQSYNYTTYQFKMLDPTIARLPSMAKDAIVFACANPTPEILPQEAKAGGAAVVSTGRSDYPNQVNNVLAFPGIFRGALDVRAADINDAMKVAAAHALSNLVSDEELTADYILPAAFDPRVRDAVASAVAEAARKSGVARI